MNVEPFGQLNAEMIRGSLKNQIILDTSDMQFEFIPSKNALNFVLHEPLHPDKRFAIGTLILGEES